MCALKPMQVEAFIRVLTLDSEQYEGRVCEHEKAFVYNSDSKHVRFVLNYTEVNQMLDLLNKAWLLFQVKQLINEQDTQIN